MSEIESAIAERRGARAGTRRGAAARGAPPGPVDAPSVERPGEHSLVGGGDVLEELLLGLEHPLRVPVEPPPRLGRLDAASRAVEQLLAEALLERPDLEADRRLCDAEPLGGLREALRSTTAQKAASCRVSI